MLQKYSQLFQKIICGHKDHIKTIVQFFKMIFMKIYALIAMASACFLLTSCTNDDVDAQNLTTSTAVNQNEFNLREGDSISSDTNPVKTNGKD